MSASTRRDLLARAGNGLGLLALAGLLDSLGLNAAEPADPLAPRPGHFPAKAKAVIWVFMNGGPSHVDTWDYKPELAKRDGTELAGFDKDTGFFTDQVGPLMGSPFAFKQHGQCGAWVSELFPALAQHVDKMAFLHSCWTDSNNHAPALLEINSGMPRMGFPSLGAWLTYGLGSAARDLPAFIAMTDTKGRGVPKGHSANWSAGFLPGIYQGTALKPQGAPIGDLERAAELSDPAQRAQLDLLARLNRRSAADGELEARIASFELAYRMQTAAPEALDLGREPAHIQKLYGLDDPRCAPYGRQCLLARRLVERGVRCVQIYSGGMDNEKSWDGHVDLVGNHRGFAAETDTPIAGLLTDLAQRGLLDSTLVIWGGEFGRLPVSQRTKDGKNAGRDHNPHAFTTWMAGGGVKGGCRHGATDEIGHKAVVDRVGVHDLHATILHLMGLDHEQLTYRFNGRDYRLTDVAGKVVRAILA
ncbi:MAG: DUF1501 domain-containing protein [Planctomycetes bacterium]|nr:DUF1501 domain-containing protein [Planctomycetota bacterium]